MKFIFQITEVDRELLRKYPPAALDGQLTILVKDAVFFHEEVIALLELAIHIASWLNEIKANQFTDFDYSADSYQENPVLHLARIADYSYAITSSWVETPADNILSLEEIIYCFNSFLRELNDTVQQAYGVTFTDMTFLNQLYRK
jgi:hypothetical protein